MEKQMEEQMGKQVEKMIRVDQLVLLFIQNYWIGSLLQLLLL